MRRSLVLASMTLISFAAPGATDAQRPAEACDRLESAFRAAPDDIAAAAAFGRCAARDEEMVAPDGDSTRLVFRSSWTSALRALRRVVQVNPTYGRAYRPLFRILFAESRDGCSWIIGACEYVSPVIRDGDTIITIPRRVVTNASADTYEQVVQQSQETRHANLVEARDIAVRWAAAAPQVAEAHAYLGRAILRLGNADSARVELELAASLGTRDDRRALFWDRMEALIKSEHGADARRVLDETVADPQRDTMQLRNFAIANLNALLGRNRPAPVDSVLARRARARIDSVIRANPLPAVRRPTLAELVAKGDTNAARKLLAREDSVDAQRRDRRFPRADESTLWSAQQHLTLGDTAGAFSQLGQIERLFNDRRFRYVTVPLGGSRPWLGRVWLLSGDLAAARGHTDEARKMYARVVGLWDGGDAEVNPIVADARRRLESLGR